MDCTLPNDQQFNLEFQFESAFKLEFQAEFGIQFGIPILMGINLGECVLPVHQSHSKKLSSSLIQSALPGQSSMAITTRNVNFPTEENPRKYYYGIKVYCSWSLEFPLWETL